MDYIDRLEALDSSKVESYVEQMILSVQYLHHRNIAHHDIKPSNFLIDKNDRLNLSDFGIAKLYPEYDLSTQYKGTLVFIAPEILSKKPYNPFKADIYSLGATIYTTIAGVPPFQAPDIPTLKKLVVSGNWYFSHNIPSKMKPLIKSCMSLDPNDRPVIDILLSQWKMCKKTCAPQSMIRLPSLVLYRQQMKEAQKHKNTINFSRKCKNRHRPFYDVNISIFS